MRSRLTRLTVGPTVAFLLAASALIATAPASGATMVMVPISCAVPNTPLQHLKARVTVNSPATVLTGHTYNAGFRAVIVGLNPTPIGIYGFSVTSNYTITGPASPSGPLSFTQTPVDYPTAPATVAFTTFHQTFTASGPAGGVISHNLSSLSYVFQLSAGGPQLFVPCTLDNGPVTVRQTVVTTKAPLFRAATATLKGRVGVSYTHLFKASGAPAPSFSLAGGTLPPGLQLASDGTLSGIPTVMGSYQFSVAASNGTPPDDTLAVTMNIARPATT